MLDITMAEIKYRCVSYPAFEPDLTWLRKMLLFVDEIHRIIPPEEVRNDSIELTRFIDAMEGGIGNCAPAPYLAVGYESAKNFGAALDRPEFLNAAKKGDITRVIGKDGRISAPGWEFLHVQKLDDSVRAELAKRNMIQPSLSDENWECVPEGVGGLVVGMLADQVAERNGWDAVTDQPLAFALNALNQCCEYSDNRINGLIGTSIASFHVPDSIGKMSIEDYKELRKAHENVRRDFAQMVIELKALQRIGHGLNQNALEGKIAEIVRQIGDDVMAFRKSKIASKTNEWVPFTVASLMPMVAGLVFGPIPGVAAGLFSFGVNAVGKATKPSQSLRYPRVMQALCSADDAGRVAAIQSLGVV